MGEAKRRKQLDPTWGKTKNSRIWSYKGNEKTQVLLQGLNKKIPGFWNQLPQRDQEDTLKTSLGFVFVSNDDIAVVAFPCFRDNQFNSVVIMLRDKPQSELTPLSGEEHREINKLILKQLNFLIVSNQA